MEGIKERGKEVWGGAVRGGGHAGLGGASRVRVRVRVPGGAAAPASPAWRWLCSGAAGPSQGSAGGLRPAERAGQAVTGQLRRRLPGRHRPGAPRGRVPSRAFAPPPPRRALAQECRTCDPLLPR